MTCSPDLSRAATYTPTAITLHWFMALALTANFVLGVTMGDLPLSPQKLQFFSWHKWTGITLLGLVTLRLIWRGLVSPPALLPASVWQQRTAIGLHILLYVLMFAIPISGWLMSSAAGVSVNYLGVLPLPDLVSKNKLLFNQLKEIHETLNYVMLGLVVVHVVAALKHHFQDRDATLARMLPWLKIR
jgi:cytochrome b561